jgi:hypothetical protein
MQAKLYLTAEEQKLFTEQVADHLRDGFNVETETLRFEDTPHRQRLRMETMYLTSPSLKAFADQVAKGMSVQDMGKLFSTFNPQDISETDFGQIFFGLGPTVMTAYLWQYLQDVRSDDDVMTLAAFTQLRHIILTSLNRAFPA